MGRIKDEGLYPRDQVISALDKVIGSDADDSGRTRNYEMRDIRDFVLSGADPVIGGTLAITFVEQDTPIPGVETPEDYVNQLNPPLIVTQYEIVFLKLTFTDSNDGDIEKTRVFVFNQNDNTFGLGETQTVSDNFLQIEEDLNYLKDLLNNNVKSVGSGEPIYKDLDAADNKHKIASVISDTIDISTEGDETLRFEIPASGVADFIVNSSYTGIEELGTLAKPFKTIQAAMDAVVGTGSITSPEFTNQTIRIQVGNGYSHTGDFNLNTATFLVEEETSIIVNPSSDWVIDMDVLSNNSATVTLDIKTSATVTTTKNGVRNSGSGVTNATFPFMGKTVRILGEGTFNSSYQGTNDADLPYVLLDISGLNGGTSHLNATNISFTSFNQKLISASNNAFAEFRDCTFSSPSSSVTQVSNNLIPIDILGARVMRFLGCTFVMFGNKFSDNSPNDTQEVLINLGNNNSTVTAVDSPTNLSVLFLDCQFNCRGISLFRISDTQPPIRVENSNTVLGVDVDNIVEYTGADPSYNTLTFLNNIINLGVVDSNVDLTRSNTTSVVNILGGVIVESLRTFPDRATAALSLPEGGVFINTNSANPDPATHFRDIVI